LPRLDRLPLALIILDGWGFREDSDHNAIHNSNHRNLVELAERFPAMLLKASGTNVGLLDGYMGNSEVGHLCIGAGRTLPQALALIFGQIESGEFSRNEILLEAFRSAERKGGAVHLMGLVSDGGVHTHIDHARAVIRMAEAEGCRRLLLHAFTDGRDTPPDSGIGYVRSLEDQLRETGVGRVAGVSGRYYAMDRDRRWDRLEKGYAALVRGEGHRAASGVAAVQAAYERGETDEFILPTVIEEDGRPVGRIADGDSVIFFNFRADRAREMTMALTAEKWDEFPRPDRPDIGHYACFMNYDESFDLPVAFRKPQPDETLGEIIAAHGIPQLRCAETEKYAHVTYFFNGVRETPFDGEERTLIQSPKVATYDLVPEMSAREVADAAERGLRSDPPRFLVVNFANADMVGHTGNYEAALKACAVVDECVGRVVKAALDRGGVAIVTSDHGNAELMVDPKSHGPHTAHTTNPVRATLIGEPFRGARLVESGQLADIAPTILTILDIPPPAQMTGHSLLRGSAL